MNRAKTVNGIEYDIVIRPLNLCIEHTPYQYDHDKKDGFSLCWYKDCCWMEIEKDCKACTDLSKSEYIAMNSLASLLLVIVDSILGYKFRKYSSITTGEWQLGYIGKLKELEE